MCETLPNCESWHEPLSLLAAGCLPAEEEAGVRRHLADCPACATRFAEVTAVAASLRRCRPSATAPAAAIRDRWSTAADRVTPRRPAWGGATRAFWLSGAVAVSLLIAIVWLVQQWPDGAPTVPQMPRVAEGGPPPVAPEASVALAWSQPTLRAYELAFAQSDEALDALLQQHGEAIVFEPYSPQSLFQESFP